MGDCLVLYPRALNWIQVPCLVLPFSIKIYCITFSILTNIGILHRDRDFGLLLKTLKDWQCQALIPTSQQLQVWKREATSLSN